MNWYHVLEVALGVLLAMVVWFVIDLAVGRARR